MAAAQDALPLRRKFGRKGNTVRLSPETTKESSVVPRNGHNRSLHYGKRPGAGAPGQKSFFFVAFFGSALSSVSVVSAEVFVNDFSGFVFVL